MNQRQENLFLKIVQEYIDSAEPVGSSLLANKYKLGVSTATIRNDMAILENEELITHPYISAGRIPTEKGYKYYLENYLSNNIKEISKKDKVRLDKLAREKNKELRIKKIAKEMANLSGLAVVVAFAKNNVYYTGISNLLAQPEFAVLPVIYNIGEVVDHLDDVITKIYDNVDEVEIKIGAENYFDESCGSILVKTDKQLICILGPMRMNYKKNIGLVNYLKILLN